MEQIKIFYDETGHTLTVWFDDPERGCGGSYQRRNDRYEI